MGSVFETILVVLDGTPKTFDQMADEASEILGYPVSRLQAKNATYRAARAGCAEKVDLGRCSGNVPTQWIEPVCSKKGEFYEQAQRVLDLSAKAE